MNAFEIICLLSLFIDVLLLAAFFHLYKKINFISPNKLDELIKNIQDTQKLTKELEKILEEKRNISKELKRYLSTGATSCQDKNNLNKKEILSLYNRGLNVTEIVKKTGLSQGEVELIISLSQTK